LHYHPASQWKLNERVCHVIWQSRIVGVPKADAFLKWHFDL